MLKCSGALLNLGSRAGQGAEGRRQRNNYAIDVEPHVAVPVGQGPVHLPHGVRDTVGLGGRMAPIYLPPIPPS